MLLQYRANLVRCRQPNRGLKRSGFNYDESSDTSHVSNGGGNLLPTRREHGWRDPPPGMSDGSGRSHKRCPFNKFKFNNHKKELRWGGKRKRSSWHSQSAVVLC